MGFFQVGVQVTRLAKDPDDPKKEPIPPPLFRPGTLLFNPDSDNMANHEKDTMASDTTANIKDPGNQPSTNVISVTAGTFNAQIGTAFSSNRFLMYQMLTGAYIGMCGVSVSRMMRHTPTPSVLCAATFCMATATSAVLLAKPKDERCM
ncbi:hypothetical protein F5883DRAFT_712644 [Diaporthe sp. PMI_573]|nr:hypothetical protein F5883DRAFT_712644 [Diaporthaceae sp. PMI_573]